MVYAKAWHVFTSQQQEEREPDGEEHVQPIPSPSPALPPTPQSRHVADAKETMFSQDSGYMSDVGSPERPEKETAVEADTSRKPDESMPGDGDGSPTECSAEERSEYAVTLQEPGSLRARTICCFGGLTKANKFARKVFRGCCNYPLGQSRLILTRSYRAPCKPLEAMHWFSSNGTIRFEWCDQLRRGGRVAVERQSVRVSAMVDAT